jgi:hypothetical protein
MGSVIDSGHSPPIPAEARCVGCGYSLFRLESNHCPECGRPFDRLDPVTMGLGNSWPRSLLRWLAKPPSNLTLLWPWVAVLCFLVAGAMPFSFLLAKVLGVIVWSIFVIGSAIIGIVRQSVDRTLRDEAKHPRMMTAAWVGTLIGAALWALLSYVPVTAILLFYFCHGELDNLERQVPAAPVNYVGFGDARVGPYSPSVGRYPNYLQVTVLIGYCPENWEPWADDHRVEFILWDGPDHSDQNDPNFQQMRPDLWHLSGNWYATCP